MHILRILACSGLGVLLALGRVAGQTPTGPLEEFVAGAVLTSAQLNALVRLVNQQQREIMRLQLLVDTHNKALACQTTVGDSTRGGDVFFDNCNVHIRNGLGRTDSTNGRGNLIVGYNEDDVFVDPRFFPAADGPNPRTGSHNLVLGPEHSYSNYGGLVAGVRNNVSGSFVSVSGGASNTASGIAASVSGGRDNTAGPDPNIPGTTGAAASVSGGGNNIASGMDAVSISGGQFNQAAGNLTSITGGFNNDTSGLGASISGGQFNTASGFAASISGGGINRASGNNASVSGGRENTASGQTASVSGGQNNTASGDRASVSGGQGHSAPRLNNWAAGLLFEEQ